MEQPQLLWLDVPFSEKDAARKAGARWDDSSRRWYAPNGLTSELQRWSALPDLPDLLPGEDRNFGSSLFVDLVPKSCWFTNARRCIAEVDWERIRRMLVRRAGHQCEACGATAATTGDRWEAHERWAYEEAEHMQRLRRLLLLCHDCHHATHFGLAKIQETSAAALEHLMAVNSWSREQAQTHVDEAFAVYRERSKLDWTLDLGVLADAGISILPPPMASERRQVGMSRLRTEGLRPVKSRGPAVRE